MSHQVTVKLSAVAAFQLQTVIESAIAYGDGVRPSIDLHASSLDEASPCTISLSPLNVDRFIRTLDTFREEYEGLGRYITPLKKRLRKAHHELTTSEEYRSAMLSRRERLNVRLGDLMEEHQQRSERLAERVDNINRRIADPARRVPSSVVERADEIADEVDRLTRRIEETKQELAEERQRLCESAELPLRAELAQHFRALLEVSNPTGSDYADRARTCHDLVALGATYVVVDRGRDRWRLGSCDSCGCGRPEVELDVVYITGQLRGEYECLSFCTECASIA